MKRAAIFLAALLSTVHGLTASEGRGRVMLRSISIEGPLTIYKAIVAFSDHPKDQYPCEVKYDAAQGTYSGAYFNNRYTRSDWYCESFSAAEAKKYYEQLAGSFDRLRMNGEQTSKN